LDYPNDTSGGGDWAFVLYLPTEAATAWYHDKIPNKPRDLPAFLHQVEHFAMSEYLSALAKGAQLPATEKANVVRRLHEYLGVSSQYVINSNLRIPYWRYQNELLRTQNKVIGRLDSRFDTYQLDAAAEAPNWDPTDVSISSAFVAAANQYYREDLKYESSLPYRANIYAIISQNGDWDFKHRGAEPTNVAPDLAEAMTQNPHLHVFSANGYYDFATPYFSTVYTLNHLNLAPALQKNISYGFYDGGHMMYLHPPSLALLKHDLARWYDEVLSSR
jgi:carboxypeptidase C (cathepsin A)